MTLGRPTRTARVLIVEDDALVAAFVEATLEPDVALVEVNSSASPRAAIGDVSSRA